MPQMSPMLWTMILLTSFTLMLINNCLIFFSLELKNKKLNNKIKFNNWLW